MQAGQLGGFIEVAKLTPGRRLQVLERMKERAASRGLGSLVGAIERAMNLQDEALELAMRWALASQNHAVHAPGAQQVDAKLDRALAGLYESLKLKVRAFEDDRVALAQGLLDALFPRGVGLLTSLP